MEPAELFDRTALSLRRARAARLGKGNFLGRHIAEELIGRLDIVKRDFSRVLNLGDDDALSGHFIGLGAAVSVAEPDLAGAAAARSVAGGQDSPNAAFDLVVSAGGLDMVGDLPGTLALIRRALRPDGLFLAGFAGAGSLPRLRAAMLAADLAGDSGVAPHIHPQIDVRAAGDLLSRTGFALPVADAEQLTVRYADLAAEVADLRAAGATNALQMRHRAALTRLQYAAAHAAFAEMADPDGRVSETIAVIYLSGWAPSPDQPRPARRGSATQSLAAALPRRSA